MAEWQVLIGKIKRIMSSEKTVKIALVGKYVEMRDAYISVAEALKHGGFENGTDVDIEWVQSEDLTAENVAQILHGVDGIIVPGGFGDRGIEGKIEAIRYARVNDIPFFGICLGMQMAVVEYARHVLGYSDAASSEFAQTEHMVIDIMPDQKNVSDKGGTMRLGLYPCKLTSGTKAAVAYEDKPLIYERHRHRYEFNNEFRKEIAENGLVLSGISPDERLVEIIELPQLRWYVGVQFHPELRSRPNRAHPLFRDFIAAASKYKIEKVMEVS